VVAYARSPGKLAIRHERLAVAGELSDAASIDRAVAGTDAVVSLLGPLPGAKGLAITEGTRHVLDAMAEHGVRRLVAVSTASARDPEDGRDWKFALLVGIMKRIFPAAYADIVAAAEAVRGSDREWTIVRLPFLTDGSKTAVAAGPLGRGIVGTLLSRANLVDFLFHQLRDRRWLRGAPAISNGRRKDGAPAREPSVDGRRRSS
ncbi:MAG: NAD(P)-dependent oxidoreductase, partial [Candidatus Binatia bacterium]